jgi:hypothetical protein
VAFFLVVASSFTEYRGHGFWAPDSKVEVWLYLLCTEIDNRRDAPQWLLNARFDWHHQATAGFMGCVSASLDQHVGSDPDRRGLVLAVAEAAAARLASFGAMIPKEVLNSFGVGGEGASFTQDLSIDVFRPVAEAFVALLRGELGWTAATSPML